MFFSVLATPIHFHKQQVRFLENADLHMHPTNGGPFLASFPATPHIHPFFQPRHIFIVDRWGYLKIFITVSIG